MKNDIKTIQEKLMDALEILSNCNQENINDEVSRSNAVSQLANTYIKSCNLIIRVEENKNNVKNKIEEINK